MGKEVTENRAVETAGTVNDMCGPLDGGDSFGGGFHFGVKPEFGDGILGHRLFVQLVLATENLTVFGFETEIAGAGSDGNGGSAELNTEKFFQVILNCQKVVLIFFEESVIDGVAQVSLASVNKRNHVGERVNIFLVIG